MEPGHPVDLIAMNEQKLFFELLWQTTSLVKPTFWYLNFYEIGGGLALAYLERLKSMSTKKSHEKVQTMPYILIYHAKIQATQLCRRWYFFCFSGSSITSSNGCQLDLQMQILWLIMWIMLVAMLSSRKKRFENFLCGKTL